ncbi:phage tail assembly chaperone [Klebsiella sp. NPDC088457]
MAKPNLKALALAPMAGFRKKSVTVPEWDNAEVTLTVPYNDDLHPEDWVMDDPDIDPPRLLFCDSEKGARHGIVQDIAPVGDGNCQITAPEYKEIFYQYDDATYPGNVA